MSNAMLLCPSYIYILKIRLLHWFSYEKKVALFPTRLNSVFVRRLPQKMVITNVLENSTGPVEEKEDLVHQEGKVIIQGTVIIIKKKVLGYKDLIATLMDRVDEMGGRKVWFELVSATTEHPGHEMMEKISKPAYVENWSWGYQGSNSGELTLNVKFELDTDFGPPGALIIRNEHRSEFYLKTVSLNGTLNPEGTLHFVCNSWVYSLTRYKTKDRVFFCNKAYLPSETPAPLRRFRTEELQTLRGNGEGKLEEWDRVYDYAYYNDLGKPDKGSSYTRPVLGGSVDYPYPHRGRTGRPPTQTDPNIESRLSFAKSLDIYVPRDERFSHLKLGEYLFHSLKGGVHALHAGIRALLDRTPTEFDCLHDTFRLYREEIKLLHEKQKTVLDRFKEFLRIDKIHHLKFPLPHIIKDDKSAWTSDEEFAREMLAGVNPVVISCLQGFPPVSKLDPIIYGDHRSTIREHHIERHFEGLSVDEAVENNKIFVLDHHDNLMPYLRRINETETKTYATRTLLLLKDDGTLKPLVIELSLPHPNGDEYGCISKVYTPAHSGVEGSIWQLAKVYVSVNDSGYHQLVCHWLNTHAVMEPFVIASNRQLSVLHPIHKLLCPHFRDTMNINALARQILIGAGGILEQTVFPGKYAMEMSSAVYKNWVFTDHAFPIDLMKRGMAVKDPNSPNGYKLFIEDYPYAVDGLEIWTAINKWVRIYCSHYYKNDDMVTNDYELQSWWQEIIEKGHGDLKHKTWWPKITTLETLIETCTIIIWICSALHAAVNFGQYPYAGYLPNRPTTSRRFMPEPNTPAYETLRTNPEKILLSTITSQWKTLLGVSLIELLSTHTADEVYLGQREIREWISDEVVLDEFEKFQRRLEEIEGGIEERNASGRLRNRIGPVNMPYRLLVPSSEAGVTARGIPNSISI